jgi:hypothetical protein
MITGRGSKKQAIVDISQQITNSVKIDVGDAFYQKTINGNSVDSGNYEEVVRMTSEFLAAGRVEPLPSSDSLFYICRSDVAKPYLDSLEINLKNKLKVFMQQGLDEDNCEIAREIYAKKLGWQGIVEGLRQSDIWKKEYEEVYAKIESGCAKIARGVYLDVNGAREKTIRNGLNKLLSDNNCHVEQKPKSGTFTIKIDAKDDIRNNDGRTDYCRISAEVEIINGKNRIPLGEITEKDGWNNMEIACERAAKAVVPKIWSNVKDKIKEVCK